jgi:hypothetical protein
MPITNEAHGGLPVTTSITRRSENPHRSAHCHFLGSQALLQVFFDDEPESQATLLLKRGLIYKPRKV